MHEAMLQDASVAQIWDTVQNNQIDPILVKYIQDQSASSATREVLFNMVGETFTKKYFGEVIRDKKLLKLPYMSKETLFEMVTKCRQELTNLTKSVVLDSDIQERLSSSIRNLALESHSKRVESLNVSDFWGPVIFENATNHNRSVPLIDAKTTFERVNRILKVNDGSVSNCEHYRSILKACQDRILPINLRRGLLKLVLFDKGAVDTAKRDISINFVERGSSENEMTLSKIHRMIDHQVNEEMRSSLSFFGSQASPQQYRDHDTTRLKRKLKSVLNQYYIMTGIHHYSQLFLATPIVFEFQKSEDVELVVAIDKVFRLMPRPKEYNGLARQIWSIACEEFPDEAQGLVALLEKFRTKEAKQLIDQPFQFFLPWIEKMLVGIVKNEAMYFIWLQCLLPSLLENKLEFDIDVFIQYCIRIFGMIREQIRRAMSIPELRQIFEIAPKRILTLSLRRHEHPS